MNERICKFYHIAIVHILETKKPHTEMHADVVKIRNMQNIYGCENLQYGNTRGIEGAICCFHVNQNLC